MLEEQAGTLKTLQDSLHSPCNNICMEHLNKEPVEPEESRLVLHGCGTVCLPGVQEPWKAFSELSHGGLRNRRCLSSALRLKICFRLSSTSHLFNHFTGFLGPFSDTEAIICVLLYPTRLLSQGRGNFSLPS